MKKINLTGIIIALIIAISVVSTTIFLVVTLLGDKPDDATQNNLPSDGYMDPEGWTDVD